MATLNLLKIWHSHLSDTICVKTGVSTYIMKCIWATGGGALRYTNYNNIKFISKHCPQESLKAIQPGAMIIPVIMSSDKTQLTHFHDK